MSLGGIRYKGGWHDVPFTPNVLLKKLANTHTQWDERGYEYERKKGKIKERWR